MYNTRSLSISLFLALLLTPLTARAQLDAIAGVFGGGADEKPEQQYHYSPDDRLEFYYEEDEITKSVRRIPMPAAEYSKRKSTEIDDRWKPFFKALIDGQGQAGGAVAGGFGQPGIGMPGAFDPGMPGAMPGIAAPDTTSEEDDDQTVAQDLTLAGGVSPIVQEMLEELGIPEERMNLLIQMAPQESQYLRYSSASTKDFILRMAEWSFFYQQLDRWNRFVADSVLRQELHESGQLSYDPSEDMENLEGIRTALQEQARQLNEDQRNVYLEMVDRVEEDRKTQTRYEHWLEDREEALMAFADQWAASYNDQTVDIESALYLVRPLDETSLTQDEMEDERPRRRLPEGRILLELPREGELTPYDLLQPDGTVRVQ